MRQKLPIIARVLVHLGAAVPLLWLLWDAAFGNLGANPIRAAQLRTGSAAIDLLFASLAFTPIQIFTGFNWILSLRAPLGRWALLYAFLHFMNFLGVDYAFNFGLIRHDLLEKRYAILGFASFLLLLSIGILSSPWLKTRLGRVFQRLKWLVYLAAILAVVHFFLQAKIDVRLPVVYAGLLSFFLIVRFPPIRKLIIDKIRHPQHMQKSRG
jgi:sulfoxide reductase heme-binding subunit YedZ